MAKAKKLDPEKDMEMKAASIHLLHEGYDRLQIAKILKQPLFRINKWLDGRNIVTKK